MGLEHFSLDAAWQKDISTLKQELTNLQQFEFSDFFLMATADYPEDTFMEIAKELKPLFDLGKITASELTKIVAVTNLVVNPGRAMNVHEPTQMALLAGVNQLYAEVGANPRDTKSDTEKSRGFTPDKAWDMLSESGYKK